MHLKMAPCGRGKAVLISVYVEKPQNRRVSVHNPRHSYHLVLLTPSHRYQHGECRTGYSKKAQLLLYIQQKREESRSMGAVSSSKPTLMSPMSSKTHIQQPRSPIQAVTAPSKPKCNTSASCLGKWKLAVPRLLASIFRPKKRRAIWSGSTRKKIKVIHQNIQVQKRCQSIFNTMASLLKRN